MRTNTGLRLLGLNLLKKEFVFSIQRGWYARMMLKY